MNLRAKKRHGLVIVIRESQSATVCEQPRAPLQGSPKTRLVTVLPEDPEQALQWHLVGMERNTFGERKHMKET